MKPGPRPPLTRASNIDDSNSGQEPPAPPEERPLSTGPEPAAQSDQPAPQPRSTATWKEASRARPVAPTISAPPAHTPSRSGTPDRMLVPKPSTAPFKKQPGERSSAFQPPPSDLAHGDRVRKIEQTSSFVMPVMLVLFALVAMWMAKKRAAQHSNRPSDESPTHKASVVVPLKSSTQHRSGVEHGGWDDDSWGEDRSPQSGTMRSAPLRPKQVTRSGSSDGLKPLSEKPARKTRTPIKGPRERPKDFTSAVAARKPSPVVVVDTSVVADDWGDNDGWDSDNF